jgi:Glyoxalase-like domain
MPSVIKSVSFDAADALALARFWAAVFGSDMDEDSTTDKAFVEAAHWGGPNIWFTRVPEPKAAKNRMNFDLRAPATVAAEVSRLEKLDALVKDRDLPQTILWREWSGSAEWPKLTRRQASRFLFPAVASLCVES